MIDEKKERKANLGEMWGESRILYSLAEHWQKNLEAMNTWALLAKQQQYCTEINVQERLYRDTCTDSLAVVFKQIVWIISLGWH